MILGNPILKKKFHNLNIVIIIIIAIILMPFQKNYYFIEIIFNFTNIKISLQVFYFFDTAFTQIY